jgi:hypothetical protein
VEAFYHLLTRDSGTIAGETSKSKDRLEVYTETHEIVTNGAKRRT